MQIKPKVFTNNLGSANDLNNLFQFYKSIWSQTFEDLNCHNNSLTSDFARFDIKVGLFDQLNNPVAFHGYQLFDLNLLHHREHPYFTQIEAPFTQLLLEKDIKRVATYEYLCICPKFRKHGHRRIGEIMAGFSGQYLQRYDIDASLGIARIDRGVDKVCRIYGGKPLFPPLSLHGVDVCVMLFRPDEMLHHPDHEIKIIIDELIEQTVPQKKLYQGVAA